MSGNLIGRAGFGALFLALFLAPLIGGFPGGAQFLHDEQLMALRCLLLLAALIVPVRPGDRLATAARAAISLAAGWSVLSVLTHSRFLTRDTLLFAMLPAAIDWVGYAAIFVLAARTAAEREGLMHALLAGGGVAALWTMTDAATGSDNGYRAMGPFFSPNFTAGFLGFCLPLAAVRLLAAATLPAALGWGTLLAAGLGGVAATGSRAGLAFAALGLAVTLGLAALLRGGKLPWIRILAAGGAAIVLTALFGFGVRAPLRARAVHGTQEQSGPFRAWTWRGSAAMAQANPAFGTGPGTYPYFYPRYALVGQTGLAHSSYLQIADEQGAPALLFAVAAIALSVLAGVSRGRRGADDSTLVAGLVGALLVGVLRSALDSEWSILGNAIPFWAVAGMLASSPAAGDSVRSRFSGALQAVALPAFLLAMPPVRAVWPPTAETAGRRGNPLEALRIEPSLRVIFPIARQLQAEGHFSEAAALFERGRQVDPNNFQLLRALAEAKEQTGDHAGALAAWQALAERQEGTFGQVRAIPETVETHPAFAYAALAADAEKRGASDEAAGLWEKAAALVERYSRTPPTYQMQEFGITRRATVLERRAAVRTLYETAMDARMRLHPSDATALRLRRDDTLKRLDAFVTPPAEAGDGGG